MGRAPSEPCRNRVACGDVETKPGDAEEVRGAELIAATCLATDLAMGFPFEHGLRATSMTMRLAERCDDRSPTASQAYHASLLMYVGCMTDAHATMQIFAGSMEEHMTPAQFGSRGEILRGVARAIPHAGAPPQRRIVEVARRFPRAAMRVRPQFEAMCEVAELLADRIGVPGDVPKLFPYLTERWDGKGVLGRAQRRRDPARDPADACRARRRVPARDRWRSPCGRDDPAPGGSRVRPPRCTHLRPSRVGDVPGRRRPLIGVGRGPRRGTPATPLAQTATRSTAPSTAIGTFAELASPYLAGHSAGVAERAAAGARACGLDDADVRLVRRAGLLHDVGRVAVHPRVWEMPGPLDADAWEQVRLHAYHADRVADRSPFLASLASIGCAHHERLDGSGYHRGLPAAGLPPLARLLAVADVYQALTEPRAHRPAYRVDEAAGDPRRRGEGRSARR